MIFGNLKPALVGIKDIGWREVLIFAPLVALTILFGVAPKPVLDMSAASVAQLLDNYKHAMARDRRHKIERRRCRHQDGPDRNDPSERRPMNQSDAMSSAAADPAGSRAGGRRHADADGRRRRAPERTQRRHRQRLLHRRAGAGGAGRGVAAGRPHRIIRRQLRRRRLCALPQAVSARRLGRRADAVARLAHAREAAEIRIRRAVPALDARHDAC